MEPDRNSETNTKTGMIPTLANGCSKIKRPSRVGLVVAVAMDSLGVGEKRAMLT